MAEGATIRNIGAIRNIGIVGGGVIGAGWAARFLLNGYDVAVFDPDPEVERKVLAVLANARRALGRLLGAALPGEGRIRFAASLAEAVRDADFVQENLPEREDLKIRLLAEIDAASPAHAVIGSSTSGLLPSRLAAGMANPARLVVGHPFNPVYLLPLVEICGGEKTDPQTIAAARALYEAVGMKPLLVRKEIDGFIADRLLEAVWREGLWLIEDDVATTAELDDAIRYGAGLRWAFMGTFLTYRLAGGEAGMRHFLEQFGPALKLPWTKLEAPELTDGLIDKIAAQSDAQAGGADLRHYERLRDDCLVQIMHALEASDFAAGAVTKAWRESLAPPGPAEGDDLPDGTVLGRAAVVEPGWIDYNDHLTEWAYLKLFGEATDTVLAHVGAGPDYVTAGHSFFTLETHIRYLDQARLGEPIEVRSRVLGADAKRIHLFHEMFCPGREAVIASGEHMMVHVDLGKGASCPAPASIAEALARLTTASADLPRPEGASRSIRAISSQVASPDG